MGKIVIPSLATETIRQATDELEGNLYFELHYDDTIAHTTKITPLYDDEIGLWEELEHRNKLRNDSKR